MNKKIMAVAVAGAFAAPTAALAQASNVQIFGTFYVEYAYVTQGSNLTTPYSNIDVMQAPGSEIGFKGEEALGGGMSAWFQCTSSADPRGAGTQNQTGQANPTTSLKTGTSPNVTTNVQGTQNSGVFCGRNSALGMKGAWGNVYAGNWDMPMKATVGSARLVSDTGIWGVGPALFGGSSSYVDNQTATSFSRRQNASIFYDSPTYMGFQGRIAMSTPNLTATGSQSLSTTPNAKPRVWGASLTYTNGPLYLVGAYESHSNFSTNSTLAGYGGTDTGWTVGATYQLGPVKVAGLYTKQSFDLAQSGAINGTVSAWNLAGEWAIVGPHALRGAYTQVRDTSGSAGTTTTYCANSVCGIANPVITLGNRVFNGGAGNTGAQYWQAQYVYNASKRTELTAGYIRVNNDSAASYNIGGASVVTPAAGQGQHAVAVSIKNTF